MEQSSYLIVFILKLYDASLMQWMLAWKSTGRHSWALDTPIAASYERIERSRKQNIAMDASYGWQQTRARVQCFSTIVSVAYFNAPDMSVDTLYNVQCTHRLVLLPPTASFLCGEYKYMPNLSIELLLPICSAKETHWRARESKSLVRLLRFENPRLRTSLVLWSSKCASTHLIRLVMVKWESCACYSWWLPSPRQLGGD